MLKTRNKIILTFLGILILTAPSFAATQKNDENRFQLGIGIMASTGNLLDLIESVRLYNAAANDNPYNFPGLTDQQKYAYQNLSGAMQRAVLVANILGSMDYGMQFRILWKPLMFETDLSILPYDGSFNGRLDFMVTPFIGVRAPFFIMPYFIAGPILTFSFYPATFTQIEFWRSRWGITSNFVFRPGINTRLGLDIKLKGFSIGAYYQYTIKDFDEFTNFYGSLVAAGFTNADAAGKIFAEQSRFGMAICLYIF